MSLRHFSRSIRKRLRGDLRRTVKILPAAVSVAVPPVGIALAARKVVRTRQREQAGKRKLAHQKRLLREAQGQVITRIERLRRLPALADPDPSSPAVRPLEEPNPNAPDTAPDSTTGPPQMTAGATLEAGMGVGAPLLLVGGAVALLYAMRGKS